MQDLNKSYDPKIVEDKIYAFWEKNSFFKADAKSKKIGRAHVLNSSHIPLSRMPSSACKKKKKN